MPVSLRDGWSPHYRFSHSCQRSGQQPSANSPQLPASASKIVSLRSFRLFKFLVSTCKGIKKTSLRKIIDNEIFFKISYRYNSQEIERFVEIPPTESKVIRNDSLCIGGNPQPFYIFASKICSRRFGAMLWMVTLYHIKSSEVSNSRAFMFNAHAVFTNTFIGE